jgi:ketosteroid isomerase-like protein
MSEENVELVRRIYALLDEGDTAVWDLAPPGFVLDFSRRLVDPVTVRGREQVRAWSEGEVAEAWEGGRTGWEPVDLIDAGDKVVAFIRTSGRGKASGVAVEAYVWNVWTFRDGRPAEWKYFGDDRAAALEAAGLPA